MQRLGIQAYRFSVAWPRVLPQGRGTPNEPGLAFYDRLIDAILAAGIEPWLCLYHWDMPQALDDLGGWTTRDSVAWFADYAALVAGRYGDRVKRFATFNEPSIFTLFGYGFGGDAGDIAGLDLLHRAIHCVNLAHGAAVDVLRARVPGSSIGAIHNYQPCLPSTPADAQAAALCDAYWNSRFPDPQCPRHLSPTSCRRGDGAAHAGRRPGAHPASRSTGSASTIMGRLISRPMRTRLGFNFGDRPAKPIQHVPWCIRQHLLARGKQYIPRINWKRIGT